MQISRVGEACKTRGGTQAMCSDVIALLHVADRPKRIRFVQTDAEEKLKPRTGNIKILSSCQDPAGVAGAEPAVRLSYGLDSGSIVTVRLRRTVCDSLTNHCGQSSRHGFEVAGVLAGYQREISTPAGKAPEYCLDVTDVLPIESKDRSRSHIRVDEQSWGSVERAFIGLSDSQNKCKLAWYHTHPTQGIFFSDGDWEAHQLFSRPFQFALVVDPKSMHVGLFYWADFDRKAQGGPSRFSLKEEME